MSIKPTTKSYRNYAGELVTETDSVATARDTVFRVLARAKDCTDIEPSRSDIADMADDLRTIAEVFSEFLAAKMADIAYVAPGGEIDAKSAADFFSAVEYLLEDLPSGSDGGEYEGGYGDEHRLTAAELGVGGYR